MIWKLHCLHCNLVLNLDLIESSADRIPSLAWEVLKVQNTPKNVGDSKISFPSFFCTELYWEGMVCEGGSSQDMQSFPLWGIGLCQVCGEGKLGHIAALNLPRFTDNALISNKRKKLFYILSAFLQGRNWTQQQSEAEDRFARGGKNTYICTGW